MIAAAWLSEFGIWPVCLLSVRMAKLYLEQLTILVTEAGLVGATDDQIECKHFFSGAAAYFAGGIFMTLTPVGLAFKLPEDECLQLFRQGFGPLQYFPGGHVKRGYALLPSWRDHDRDDLFGLIERSVEYARL